MGVRKDVPDLLAAPAAFVLSSVGGLFNVVMEALAEAKPVVAAQLRSVPGLVEGGKSGFLVPPGGSGVLA
ncbi:MAG TPA: glycosyltransferase family 4 protein [Firmicutes bacterium]|nr:glycosyltransferase family 4 protein [Bacillota bacterium]